MTLKLGWTPDVPDERDVLLGASPLLNMESRFQTDNIDLSVYQGEVLNQIANNCCNHALNNVAVGTANAMGSSIKQPSAMFGWMLARLLAAPRHPLSDIGCSLRLMFKALSAEKARSQTSGLGYGLLPEVDWPEVAENINSIAPEDLWRTAENASIRDYARCKDGSATPEALLAVLRRGRPVTIAMIVDQAFRDVGRQVYSYASGAPLGGHAMTVVGYSTALKAFRVKNSWGKDFGDQGYCWIDRDYVARFTFDKWYVNVLPEGS